MIFGHTNEKNKFKKVAQEVILSEIKSLNKLKASIDNNFHKVIEAIINCKKGKIILSELVNLE